LLKKHIILFCCIIISIFLGETKIAYAEALNQEAIEKSFNSAKTSREKAILEAFQSAENKITLPKEKAGFFSFILSQISPYFSLNTEYNDNIYLTKDNPKSDITNIFNPGIKFVPKEGGESKWKTEFDIGTNIYNNLRHSEQNSQTPYINFLLQIGQRKRILKIKQAFEKVLIATSSLESGTEGISEYSVYNTGLNYKRTYNRLGYELDYQKTTYNYEKEFKSTNNYFDHNFGITGFIIPPAMPKTEVFWEYNYGQIEYTKTASTSRNADYFKYGIGIRGEITKKIKGVVKFGYQQRDNKEGSDYATTTVNVNLNYRFLPKDNLALKIMRQINESSYAGEGASKENGLSLNYQHIFNQRLNSDIGIAYSQSKNNSNRKDNLYTYSLGLSYSFRSWLQSNIKYTHQEKDSNFINSDYKNNSFSLGLRMGF